MMVSNSKIAILSFIKSNTYSLPKGFTIKISFGSKVKTEIIAKSIAIPVKTPKYIVGIKLDTTSIENPKIILIEVFKIATPTVSCHFSRVSL